MFQCLESKQSLSQEEQTYLQQSQNMVDDVIELLKNLTEKIESRQDCSDQVDLLTDAMTEQKQMSEKFREKTILKALEGNSSTGLDEFITELSTSRSETKDGDILIKAKKMKRELDIISELPCSDNFNISYAAQFLKLVDEHYFNPHCKELFLKSTPEFCPIESASLLALASVDIQFDRLPYTESNDEDEDDVAGEVFALSMPIKPNKKALHAGPAQHVLYLRPSQRVLLAKTATSNETVILNGSPGIGKSSLELAILALYLQTAAGGKGNLSGMMGVSGNLPEVILRQVDANLYVYFLEACLAYKLKKVDKDYVDYFCGKTAKYLFEPLADRDTKPLPVTIPTIIAVSLNERRICDFAGQGSIRLYLDHLSLQQLLVIGAHMRETLADSTEKEWLSETQIKTRFARHGGVLCYVLGTSRESYLTVWNERQAALSNAAGIEHACFTNTPLSSLSHHLVKYQPITTGDNPYQNYTVEFVNVEVRNTLYATMRCIVDGKSWRDLAVVLIAANNSPVVQMAGLPIQFEKYINECLRYGASWGVLRNLTGVQMERQLDKKPWKGMNYKVDSATPNAVTLLLGGPRPGTTTIEGHPPAASCRESRSFANMKLGAANYPANPVYPVAVQLIKTEEQELSLFQVTLNTGVRKVTYEAWLELLKELNLSTEEAAKVKFHYYFVCTPRVFLSQKWEIFFDSRIPLASVNVVEVPTDYTSGVKHPDQRY